MKKLLLSILFLMVCSTAHAATTWYACTSGGNWSANVWTSVSADQGTCVASLGTPVAGDTAILNSSSGNITITGAAAAAFLDETGYTGTLAFGTQTLTLTTGANLGGAMTSTSGTISSGGGTITLLSTATGSFPTLKTTASQTFTANSYTWPGVLTFGGGTITFNNSGATWTNSGQCNTTTNGATLNKTITGDSLTCSNGMNINSGSIVGASTAIVYLTGGTWLGNTCTTNIASNLTIAGNVTISGTVCYGNSSNTLTYSSGTVTTTGSTLDLTGSQTLDTSGMTWGTVSFNGGGTLTLNSPLITTILNNATVTETLNGAFNITTQTLSNTGGGGTINFLSGQTLNITSSIKFTTSSSATIKSVTASSPTYINYTGIRENQNIDGVTFTDVQASGNTLYNYNGGTLTRTNNIKNVNASNINPKATNYALGV